MKVMFRRGMLIRKATQLWKGSLTKRSMDLGSEVPSERGLVLKALVLAAALLFFWGIPGKAWAAISSTNLPALGSAQENMPLYTVNQALTVTFDQDIGTVDTSMISFKNADNTVGNFVYSKSGSTLTIVPVFDGTGSPATISTTNKMLEYNKKYTLKFTAGAVMDNATPANSLIPSDTTYTFTTAHNFDTLLQYPATLGSLITTNAPRGLNILIPKKYMTKFDISYITKAGTTTLASPLTSVDITVDPDVADIDVTFGSAPTPVPAQKLDNVFNAGYQGVMTTTDVNGKEVGLDIKFSAYDKDGRLLEEKTIKLDPKGKQSVTTNSKKLNGTKTLQDLIMNNGKLFTDILSQYSTTDLALTIRK
ncbi:hypothetical protein JCM15765_29330 [Paradesulfitobacterium aromaticivorans]